MQLCINNFKKQSKLPEHIKSDIVSKDEILDQGKDMTYVFKVIQDNNGTKILKVNEFDVVEFNMTVSTTNNDFKLVFKYIESDETKEVSIVSKEIPLGIKDKLLDKKPDLEKMVVERTKPVITYNSGEALAIYTKNGFPTFC